MRKFVKKEILSIFQTLYDAHTEIKKFIEKRNYDIAQMILGDCQKTAVQIGTVIEQSEGEGFVTVKYLEEYCEALYEVSQNIGGDYSGNKAQKALGKKLIAAENSIKADVVVRIEAVFLPYKCAMVDSLLSVFEAASNDPLCDAYLIPIPYYDRNSDGSLGQFHYEGDEYPDDLQITHYEAYDIAARKPDVIYIHNPYDDCNYVTSVDPRYYSSELKKHTDMLVYIPYFVLQEISPENRAAVKNIEHFILSPAVLNADKVIVQSEEMRQIYINVLLEHRECCSDSRAALEKKILGLGSPKFDKIMSTERDSIIIPEEWRKVIFKNDGSQKKVVMYNTGITGLLQYNEKWIDKIEDTFKVFKENTEYAALIWRPHPLIESTLHSMRPEIMNRYNELKEKYISEAWGVLDISSNLNRAVAVCDVYYGDFSSVVQLFEALSKQCLIQDMLYNMSDSVSFCPGVFCVGKVNAWFVQGNAIFRYDFDTGKINMVKVIEDEVYKTNLFLSIHLYRDILYLIPAWGNAVYSYKISENSVKKINIEPQNEISPGYFTKSFEYGENIYCIPMYYNYFVRISKESGEITRIADWKKEFFENSSDLLYINWAQLMSDDKVCCAVPDAKSIIIFDMKTCLLEKVDFGGENVRYTSVAAADENLFVYDMKNRKIILYKKEADKYKAVRNLDCEKLGLCESVCLYSVDDKSVIINDRNGIKTITADCELNYFENSFDEAAGAIVNNSSEWRHGMLGRFNDSWYYFRRYNNVLYVKKGENIESYPIVLNNESLISEKEKLYDSLKNKTSAEDGILCLNDFLKYTKCQEHHVQKSKEQCAGYLIHGRISKEAR